MRRFILLISSICLLTACDSKSKFKDLQDYVHSVMQKEMVTPPKTVPQYKLPTPVAYKAATIRSPFEKNEALVAKKNLSLPALQSYPLSNLRFLGTITRGKITFAFISAPDNIIYQVKEGDVIGDQHGIVSQIYPDRMVITEQVVEKGKATMQSIVTLQLKEEH